MNFEYAVRKQLFEHTHLKEIEVVESVYHLGSIRRKMVGLCATVGEGKQAVGSAVGGEESWIRAYSELLERATLQLGDFSSLDPRFFPTAPEGARWQWSKSNGVAAHPDFSVAVESAQDELIERDRVLRSWFGEFAPIRLRDFQHPDLIELSLHYDLGVYDFGEKVAGIFGFPLDKNRPLLFGWGRKRNFEESLQHAVREAIQRIAFLWDEPPCREVTFSPTVHYHLDYYLIPENERWVRDWLNGKNADQPQVKQRNLQDQKTMSVLDITPSFLKGITHVVKAHDEDRMPLCFGEYPEWILSRFGLKTQTLVCTRFLSRTY